MALRQNAAIGRLVVEKDIQFGNNRTGQTKGAASAGLFGGAGTTTSPAITSQAGKNFLDFRTRSTDATGADSRGIYWRHELTGAGASGETARFFTIVKTTTNANAAHGLHASMELADTGNVAGQGCAVRATLGAAAATRNVGGSQAALILDSNYATGNTLTGRVSLLRLTKSGAVDITTFLDIADDQCLKGSAASGAASDALKVLLPDGTVRYISLVAAS